MEKGHTPDKVLNMPPRRIILNNIENRLTRPVRPTEKAYSQKEFAAFLPLINDMLDVAAGLKNESELGRKDIASRTYTKILQCVNAAIEDYIHSVK